MAITNQATIKMITNIINGTTPIQAKGLLNAFPVGSIIGFADSTNPAQVYGGTWQKIQGKFLYSVGGGRNLR